MKFFKFYFNSLFEQSVLQSGPVLEEPLAKGNKRAKKPAIFERMQRKQELVLQLFGNRNGNKNENSQLLQE